MYVLYYTKNENDTTPNLSILRVTVHSNGSQQEKSELRSDDASRGLALSAATMLRLDLQRSALQHPALHFSFIRNSPFILCIDT